MKVLIVEDQIEEILKAVQAVFEAGHTPAFCASPRKLANGEEGEQKWRDMYLAHIRPKLTSSLWSYSTPFAGIDCLVAEGETFGVLTDLMFPLTESSGRQGNGVLVALHAISKGVPVVICTDADGDHHAGPCGAIRDGYCTKGERVFGFIETKDWNEAMRELERQVGLSKT